MEAVVPDGADPRLVLLNEAWEVLFHPESRRHYDAARSGATDAAVAAAFEQEVAAARRKAADYPAEWASFELWLESVAREFTQTRYLNLSGSFMNWLPSDYDVEVPRRFDGAYNIFPRIRRKVHHDKSHRLHPIPCVD